MTVSRGAFLEGFVVGAAGAKTAQVEVDIIVCIINMLAGECAPDAGTGLSRLFMALYAGYSTACYMLGMAVGRGHACPAVSVIRHAVAGGTTMTGGACQRTHISPFRLGVDLSAVDTGQAAGGNAAIADAVAISTVAGQIVTAVIAKRVESIEFNFARLVDMPCITGRCINGGSSRGVESGTVIYSQAMTFYTGIFIDISIADMFLMPCRSGKMRGIGAVAAAALGGGWVAPFGCGVGHRGCLAVRVTVSVTTGTVAAAGVRGSVIVRCCSDKVSGKQNIYLMISVLF